MTPQWGVPNIRAPRRSLRRSGAGTGAIAQLGERLHGMQEVGGSIPPSSTKQKKGTALRPLFFLPEVDLEQHQRCHRRHDHQTGSDPDPEHGSAAAGLLRRTRALGAARVRLELPLDTPEGNAVTGA